MTYGSAQITDYSILQKGCAVAIDCTTLSVHEDYKKGATCETKFDSARTMRLKTMCAQQVAQL
jgi:hypothetical protein